MRRTLTERTILGLPLVVLLLLGMTSSARAQAAFEAQDVNVSYSFGRQITFQARLASPIGISQASILFRASTEETARVETLTLDPTGMTYFTYDASLNVLPPFSTVLFWFQAVLADGSTQASPVFNFQYDDNRFSWGELSEGGVTVHWYEGDGAFGQAALDSARAGIEAARQLLPSPPDSLLDVYIYSNASDLRNALFLGGRQWTGGHADPALGVVLVAIAPGEAQGIEMQTEIPHELAHVLLYRELGDGYARLPVWLSEGLATMMEAYPKPDYANALMLADRDGSLIPFASLCASFPPDSGRAFLAYAQSGSFVRYLRDSYGSTGLTALIHAYADGLDCEHGAARALGVPLSQLDTRWRGAALGQNAAGAALRKLAPYLVVMALALVLPLWGVVKMLAERRKYERRSG